MIKVCGHLIASTHLHVLRGNRLVAPARSAGLLGNRDVAQSGSAHGWGP